MKSKISKWGHAIGVRIPRDIARKLNLSAGDTVSIEVKNGAIVMTPQDGDDLASLLAKVTDENQHGETNWGADQGRERL
jgi:antitoxin MazE